MPARGSGPACVSSPGPRQGCRRGGQARFQTLYDVTPTSVLFDAAGFGTTLVEAPSPICSVIRGYQVRSLTSMIRFHQPLSVAVKVLILRPSTHTVIEPGTFSTV